MSIRVALERCQLVSAGMAALKRSPAMNSRPTCSKDQVVRRLNYLEIQNVQGIWTAKVLEMFDLKRNSRTRLTLDKLQYNVPMKDDDFTLPALRR